ncbi:MAG TPA: hypothetical protein VEZ89_00845 [Rubrivivax sp.]|nr:hypothetical protein [Rubrivivax sp.]
MNSPPPPRDDKPAETQAFEAQRQAWAELQHEMSVLHARLEYVRLLLKLRLRPPC